METPGKPLLRPVDHRARGDREPHLEGRQDQYRADRDEENRRNRPEDLGIEADGEADGRDEQADRA